MRCIKTRSAGRKPPVCLSKFLSPRDIGEKEKYMEKVLVIFGSAVTGNFATRANRPRDIDILTNMPENEAAEIVNGWSMEKFGETLPLDIHPANMEGGKLVIPVLGGDEKAHEFLVGSCPVKCHRRNSGFSSFLRLYGGDFEAMIKELGSGNQHLSLLPERYSYFSDLENEDKYYGGLKGFRNAAEHCPEFEKLCNSTNCRKILQRLLTEDPLHWQASKDIVGNPIPYGIGWSHAADLIISADKSAPCLADWQGNGVGEDEAERILWGEE